MKSNKRKAFFSWTALLVGITILGTLGMVISPRVQALYETKKVQALIDKENFIRQLYEIYYDNAQGDMTDIPADIDSLIARAKSDKLIIGDFDKSNGFDGNISFTVDRGLFKISGNLTTTNAFILGQYRSLIDKSSTGNITENGVQKHIYSLSGSIKNNIAKFAYFSLKAQDAGAVTSEGAANALTSEQKATTKWWDYNVQTGSYEVKSWDTASGTWKTDETKTLATEMSSQFYTGTSTSDVDATKVEAGSKLYVNDNGTINEYIAYDGEWKSLLTAAGGYNINVMSIPAYITDLNYLLNRGVDGYFNAPIGSVTKLVTSNGAQWEFVRDANYWKCAANNTYVAATLDQLPSDVTSGSAYLVENNTFSTPHNGINGITGLSTADLNYEAIFSNNEWIYRARTITQVLNNALYNGKEYYVDELGVSVSSQSLIAGEMYWKDMKNFIFITLGDRDNLPSLLPYEKSAVLILTAKNLKPTRYGGFKYFTTSGNMYMWRIKDNAYSVNSLTDGPFEKSDIQSIAYNGLFMRYGNVVINYNVGASSTNTISRTLASNYTDRMFLFFNQFYKPIANFDWTNYGYNFYYNDGGFYTADSVSSYNIKYNISSNSKDQVVKLIKRQNTSTIAKTESGKYYLFYIYLSPNYPEFKGVNISSMVNSQIVESWYLDNYFYFLLSNGQLAKIGIGTSNPTVTYLDTKGETLIAPETSNQMAFGSEKTRRTFIRYLLTASGKLYDPINQSVISISGETVARFVPSSKDDNTLSSYTYLVVTSSGKIYTWGNNYGGVCGLGHTTNPVASPTLVNLSGELVHKDSVITNEGYASTGDYLIKTNTGKYYSIGSKNSSNLPRRLSALDNKNIVQFFNSTDSAKEYFLSNNTLYNSSGTVLVDNVSYVTLSYYGDYPFILKTDGDILYEKTTNVFSSLSSDYFGVACKPIKLTTYNNINYTY